MQNEVIFEDFNHPKPKVENITKICTFIYDFSARFGYIFLWVIVTFAKSSYGCWSLWVHHKIH